MSLLVINEKIVELFTFYKWGIISKEELEERRLNINKGA